MSQPTPELWTAAEFAAYAKLSPAQVSHLRRTGDGPPFTKIGRAVRYVPGAVHRWIVANQQTTTKDTSK